jgi:hypothetical protein
VSDWVTSPEAVRHRSRPMLAGARTQTAKSVEFLILTEPTHGPAASRREHRPEDPILLPVDQQLGEGP